MTKEIILDRIQQNIRELFMDESIIVTRDTVFSHVEGWDSFEHINLLVSIEHEFNVRFVMSEVMLANCMEDLVNLIQDAILKG
jgi:acyl carrier protein